VVQGTCNCCSYTCFRPSSRTRILPRLCSGCNRDTFPEPKVLLEYLIPGQLVFVAMPLPSLPSLFKVRSVAKSSYLRLKCWPGAGSLLDEGHLKMHLNVLSLAA
jgi:hypothetical protein